MDIKLKNKLSKPVRIILICTAGILLCVLLYYFIDIGLNGSFIDWFERHYMLTEMQYIGEAGKYGLVREPDYSALKGLILKIFIAGIVIWLLTLMLSAYMGAKFKVRKAVTQTSEMMRAFMDKDVDAADIFPKEYAEISTQMVEIKAVMQKHEQILKDEASRKNDLIAYLAHDLKTPLTSIMGYLSLLDEAADMPKQQRIKYVNIALDKAMRLENLINEFFEITRYNLKQIEIEKERIDLYYMFLQMTDEFYPLLQTHGNSIDLDVRENISIYGDAEKLARVFNNVLKNAIAYSYAGSEIKIWTQKTGADVNIYFQNRGMTIPAKKLDAIFDKFFRLDKARSTDTGGAGLGLAIAKEIVDLHGGTIKADSRDDVTTFCISIPCRNE